MCSPVLMYSFDSTCLTKESWQKWYLARNLGPLTCWGEYWFENKMLKILKSVLLVFYSKKLGYLIIVIFSSSLKGFSTSSYYLK